MSAPAEPVPGGPVQRLATALAMAAGAVLLATAGLTTASVLCRWLLGQPIAGDFELVSIGSGLGAFGFLAYGTLRRSNILVDTATTWLPARVNHGIDAVWMLVWAAILLVLAERMAQGAMDTLGSGTTTMVLGLPTWWAIGIGAACLAATALVALRWCGWLLRGRG